ncbi:hypothetical protein WMF04_04960 [Sorangium sp. So ce260]
MTERLRLRIATMRPRARDFFGCALRQSAVSRVTWGCAPQHGIERARAYLFAHRRAVRAASGEPFQHPLHRREQGDVEIQANGGNVFAGAVLQSDGGALGGPAVGKGIRIVLHHFRKAGIGDARQAHLGGGLADGAAGQGILDGDHRLPRVGEIVQHDLAAGREHAPERFHDLASFAQQQFAFRQCRLACAGRRARRLAGGGTLGGG